MDEFRICYLKLSWLVVGQFTWLTAPTWKTTGRAEVRPGPEALMPPSPSGQIMKKLGAHVTLMTSVKSCHLYLSLEGWRSPTCCCNCWRLRSCKAVRRKMLKKCFWYDDNIWCLFKHTPTNQLQKELERRDTLTAKKKKDEETLRWRDIFRSPR